LTFACGGAGRLERSFFSYFFRCLSSCSARGEQWNAMLEIGEDLQPELGEKCR
jgi:hypothetical protein